MKRRLSALVQKAKEIMNTEPPAEELEFTVRVKAIRHGIREKWTAEDEAKSLADKFFRRGGHTYFVEVLTAQYQPLPEAERIKWDIFDRLVEEMQGREVCKAGKARICDWDYCDYSGAKHFSLTDDCMKPKLIGLTFLPLDEHTVHITCKGWCEDKRIDVKCDVKDLRETVIKILDTHVCQPWPG
jgi:hypothetical protein